MAFRTALFVALCIVAVVFYAFGAATNIATKSTVTVSLWEICSGTNCADALTGICSDATDMVKAGRALTILACIFAGFAMISGAVDMTWSDKIHRWQSPALGIVGCVCGLLAFAIGFAAVPAAAAASEQFRSQGSGIRTTSDCRSEAGEINFNDDPRRRRHRRVDVAHRCGAPRAEAKRRGG
jgi:hypothetical protein